MSEKKLDNVFEHPPGVIPLFNSLEAFQNYMDAMQKQCRKEKTAGGR